MSEDFLDIQYNFVPSVILERIESVTENTDIKELIKLQLFHKTNFVDKHIICLIIIIITI